MTVLKPPESDAIWVLHDNARACVYECAWVTHVRTTGRLLFDPADWLQLCV